MTHIVALVTREACVLDEGVNMKAYAIHFKKHILGLYVCSPNGKIRHY